MKILAVSDCVVDRLYTPHLADLFRDVELILGCGDLSYEYLEFLVSSLNVPLLYIPGNHDPGNDPNNPESRAEGGDNLDLRILRCRGLTFAGFGGSIRYKPYYPNQYTQQEMYLRFFSFLPRLLLSRLRDGHFPDVVIAHSPPYGINDDQDPAHTGFHALRFMIRLLKPRYFLHGHTHQYLSNLNPSLARLDNTTIINVYPYRLLEVKTL
jgi:Icc-related predicted phosphoesterase